MRYLVPLLFFITYSTVITASTPTLDSLVQLVEQKRGKEKVDALNELSVVLLEHGARDDAKEKAYEALELAQGISYTSGQANALDNLGYLFQAKNDAKNAIKSFYDAYDIRKGAFVNMKLLYI